MDWLFSLLSNKVLIVAGGSWLFAQILKTIINFIMTKEFKLERLVGAGGMPSCHSATVCALAVMTAFECGLDSANFALAVILAIIVMYDARGVRQETGKQAVVINQLQDYLFQKGEKVEFTYDDLKELVGHTMLQVCAGAVLGIVIGVLCGIFWV